MPHEDGGARLRFLALSCVLIVTLGILVYGNHLHNPFQFDSVYYITGKQGLDRPADMLTLAHWKKEYFARGLLQGSLALNAALDGMRPFGYHLVNLTLHIFNALLILFVTERALRYFRIDRLAADDRAVWPLSLFTALLFLCHPIQTESVVYIMSRSEVLAATFYLGAFLIFQNCIGPQRRRGRSWKIWIGWALVAALFLLGFSAKQSVATFPAILVLYSLLGCAPESRAIRFLLRWKWAIAAAAVTGIVLLLAKLLSDESFLIGPIDPAQMMGRKNYMLSQPGVLVFYYLKLLLFPVNLNVDPHIEMVTGIFSGRFLLASTIIVAVLYRFAAAGSSRIFLFCGLWFFIVISPSSSIVTLQDLAAEHRVYLASYAFYLLTALTLFLAIHRTGDRTESGKKTVWIFLLVTTALCVMTANRNLDWRSERVLWLDAARKSPLSDRPLINLARAHSLEGDIGKAIHYYEKAIEKRPDLFLIHYNLGDLYMQQGRPQQALALFEKAKRLAPQTPEIHGRMGEIYLGLGQYELADRHLRQAVELNPKYTVAMRNLGLVNYYHRDRKEEGLLYFARALTLDPDQPEAEKIRGLLERHERRSPTR